MDVLLKVYATCVDGAGATVNDRIADALAGKVIPRLFSSSGMRITSSDRALAVYRGAPGRIRTCDTRFRKPMLYPLSYEGARA